MGIVHREIYWEEPPKVECSLTHLGRKLELIILLTRDWGNQYIYIQVIVDCKQAVKEATISEV